MDLEDQTLTSLLPLVYQELRQMAHRQLGSQRPGDTLNTTALVHEAYLKLAHHPTARWHDRSHFLRVAAMAMRQVVVDYARRRQAYKRGGGCVPIPLAEWDGQVRGVEHQAAMLVALDDALIQLGRLDPRLVTVVELRFFAGCSVVETAQALGLSPVTVKRDTRIARAFLEAALKS